MALVRALPGESVQIEAWFRGSNGRPLIPAPGAAASYSIRDAAGNLLVNGVGIQDSGNPARWYSTVTIPIDAPVNTSPAKSSVTWDLATNDGSIPTLIEMFEVGSPTSDIPTGQSTDIVLMEGMPFGDSLMVPTIGLPPIASVDYRIVSENGGQIYHTNNVAPLASGPASTSYGVSDLIPQLNTGSGIGSYLGMWTVSRTGMMNVYEVHPIYVANPQLLKLMNDLRMLIDRARLSDINPNLNWTAADLLHFILKGIEYVASSPPTITSISPANIPAGLSDYIVKAAAVAALRAQFLAEGMSSFDFQGLGVQLNVDRTQYIQAMIDGLQADLDNRLSQVKAAAVRQGGRGGALAVSVGVHTNYPMVGWGLGINGVGGRNFWNRIPYIPF